MEAERSALPALPPSYLATCCDCGCAHTMEEVRCWGWGVLLGCGCAAGVWVRCWGWDWTCGHLAALLGLGLGLG